MTKTIELDVATPVLNYLQRQAGEGFSKALGQVAASGDGLSRLEGEIRELRHAVAKASDGRHSGGPRDVLLRLAEVEQKADRVGERELKTHFEKQAAELRRQIAEG